MLQGLSLKKSLPRLFPTASTLWLRLEDTGVQIDGRSVMNVGGIGWGAIIHEPGFALASVTNSEWQLQLLFWACCIVFFLNVSMVILIIAARVVRAYRERRSSKSVELWRPLMISALFEESFRDIKPGRAEWTDVLLLWNHLQESLAGEGREKLVIFARFYKLDKIATLLLEKGNKRVQLLAISALGHLREKSAWNSLRRLMVSNNPVVALAAARAMVQIDPGAAMPLFVPQLCTRREWPQSKVATILKEADPEIISKPLAAAALFASREDAPRMIRFLAFVHHAAIAPTIHRILETASDPEVLVACFEVLNDPIDLDKVRCSVAHDSWRVRMTAAATLGRIGTKQDTQLLINRLSDDEWWVRYTAARSLVRLPWMTPSKVRSLQENRSAPREQAILNHVIAEMNSL
jgi:hypothetical protein